MESDISINNETRLQINNNPRLTKNIIKLQSHIRGLISRTQFNGKLYRSHSFLPYLESDIPYVIAECSIITEEEIQLLYSNYSQWNDGVALVCCKPIEYSNGCQYYGEFNQNNNQKHGRGILKWQEGPVYIGQFRMDKANGKGKVIWNKEEYYDGDWEDSKANGFGVYISKDVQYEGKWKEDRQDGIGTETWWDGTSYTGEFKCGKKTGKGKFKYKDGSTYNGQFYNNQLHGKGIYIWGDKREYNGEWKYSKLEGEGVFKWPDGRKYIGHYLKDKKDGYGIFEWPDGKKYKGYWRDGKRQGEGEFYNPKDKIWQKGNWNEGKIDSKTESLFNNSLPTIANKDNWTHNNSKDSTSINRIKA